MSLGRLLPKRQSRFSYGNQLSRRILKAGRWRAKLREQSAKYGDGRTSPGFQFSHLLIGGTWLWIIAAILFGGVLHICTVLYLPEFATKSGWSRVADLTPVNEIMILPDNMAGNEILPRMAPDVRYAFCRYSLVDGPVELIVPMASNLWTVSIHNTKGDNFYTISGSDVKRGEATFKISATAPQVVENAKAARIKQDSEFTIAPAPKTGLVVIRAPIQGKAHAAFTDTLIRRAVCRPFA